MKYAILLLGLLTTMSMNFTDAHTGVCYGRLGDALPCPSKVVALYKQHNIRRMQIYDPDEATLRALSCSNIELTLGVPNEDLERLASCQSNADAWIRHNVTKYPSVRFRHIIAGNEVNHTSAFAPFVLPAMQNIYAALCASGQGGNIKVSTGIDTTVLDKSYPPQDGVFKASATPYLDPIIHFLINTSAPLFVSIYPYFAYINDKRNIKLSYALLEPNSGIVLPDGTRYDNLFYAMFDSVYAAVEKRVSNGLHLDAGKVKQPDIQGSESGWSTSNGRDDSDASIRNARIYNNNLIRVVKNGTPKRPGKPIDTFIFAMFDENLKTGKEEERHFGIFSPNGKPKYSLTFL